VIQADVGNQEDVQNLFAECVSEMGGIDLLVNNAAVQTWSPVAELDLTDWTRTLQTNLTGTFLCTKVAAQHMSAGGAVINIGSGANAVPFPNLADYCASKGGLGAFTRVCAIELGARGIRVNCVAPGAIEIERTLSEHPKYAETWGKLTPLGRVGRPDDIGDAVVFLASQKASFITGQTLYVDGGLWVQGPWPY
jgi:NAD(P)-dependent dehydrogenase (short-subunit alcohol dehydrogenase family)